MSGVKYVETLSGHWIQITSASIKKMGRDELVRHLERRGFAVYDDESTAELREVALIDFKSEK